MSCFAPERAHRWTKTIGAFAFNHMCRTMTSRMAGAMLDHATDMDTFNACVMGPAMPTYWRKYGGLIQAHFRKLGARASSKAMTHPGSVSAGDFLALRCSGGGVAIAWCLACCGCDGQVAFVVSQLATAGSATYPASPSGAAYVVQSNVLLARLIYYNVGEFVHVYVTHYLEMKRCAGEGQGIDLRP